MVSHVIISIERKYHSISNGKYNILQLLLFHSILKILLSLLNSYHWLFVLLIFSPFLLLKIQKYRTTILLGSRAEPQVDLNVMLIVLSEVG